MTHTMPVPDVSVLIAVHNGHPYVEDAVRSMMRQTLRNIEIIIVDDASTDSTPDVLARLAAEDPRLRIETLRENARLPRALNHGLALARAPYVARMDADDLSHPTRLAVQKAFLDAHPEVILLGTSYRQIDADGHHTLTSVRPRDDFANRWVARFHMPLTHPTFMMRRDGLAALTPPYDPVWTVAEDYDLVVRLMTRGKVVCLSDVLLDYRVHGSSITGKNWALQNQQMMDISSRHLAADLGPDIIAALAPVQQAFYGGVQQDPAVLFDGFRRMIAADLRQRPGAPARLRRWMYRQSAQMILRTLQRSRQSRGQIARAFLLQGRDFLIPLLMRSLEIKRWLPRPLRSDPPV